MQNPIRYEDFIVTRPSMNNFGKNLLEIIVAKNGYDQKIRCMKDVRSVSNLGLKESKDIVELYMKEYPERVRNIKNATSTLGDILDNAMGEYSNNNRY